MLCRKNIITCIWAALEGIQESLLRSRYYIIREVKMMYKIINNIKIKLCGSCLNGVEYEEDGTSSMCCCRFESFGSLLKQNIIRRRNAKRHNIF